MKHVSMILLAAVLLSASHDLQAAYNEANDLAQEIADHLKAGRTVDPTTVDNYFAALNPVESATSSKSITTVAQQETRIRRIMKLRSKNNPAVMDKISNFAKELSRNSEIHPGLVEVAVDLVLDCMT